MKKAMYLIDTTNETIKNLFGAKKGKSLITGKIIYSGTLMNLRLEDRIVTDNSGKELFRISTIQKIYYDKKNLVVLTKNSKYVFGEV